MTKFAKLTKFTALATKTYDKASGKIQKLRQYLVFANLKSKGCTDFSFKTLQAHLDFVTTNKRIKDYVINYYQALQAKNIYLKRSDFDRLTLVDQNGKKTVLEQTVVLELFKNRDEIPAEELFVYRFVHNLMQIKTFSFEQFHRNIDPSWTAWYSHTNNKIFLQSQFKIKVLDRQSQFENFENMLHEVFFHEIGHTEERKSFGKLEFFGLEVEPFGSFDYDFLTDLLDNNYMLYNGERRQLCADSYVKGLIQDGSCEFGEIINEISTASLLSSLHYSENAHFNNDKYYFKTMLALFDKENLPSPCSYYFNADIVSMQKIMFPSLSTFQIRQKSIALKNALNSLNVDENIWQKIRDYLDVCGVDIDEPIETAEVNLPNFDIIKDILADGKVLQKYCKFSEKTDKKISNFSLMMLMLGVVEEVRVTDQYKITDEDEEFFEPDEAFELKSLLQAFLINGYKNKLIKKLRGKDLNNPNISSKLLENLMIIDQILIKSQDGEKTAGQIEFLKLLKALKLEKEFCIYRFKNENKLKEQNIQM